MPAYARPLPSQKDIQLSSVTVFPLNVAEVSARDPTESLRGVREVSMEISTGTLTYSIPCIAMFQDRMMVIQDAFAAERYWHMNCLSSLALAGSTDVKRLNGFTKQTRNRDNEASTYAIPVV